MHELNAHTHAQPTRGVGHAARADQARPTALHAAHFLGAPALPCSLGLALRAAWLGLRALAGCCVALRAWAC